MPKTIFPTLTLALLSTFAYCSAKSFDFKDPKGVNNIIFQMDAPLESINGSADGISGMVSFDPQKPEKTTGSILLNASSLHVGNKLLKEHMLGKDWMNVSKYPTVKFNLSKLTDIKRQGIDLIAVAEGKMTIRNVTTHMLIPVKLTYLKDMLVKRNRVPGDLLVLLAKFVVTRDDFNIQKGKNLEKVANEIEISLNLAGASPDS